MHYLTIFIGESIKVHVPFLISQSVLFSAFGISSQRSCFVPASFLRLQGFLLSLSAEIQTIQWNHGKSWNYDFSCAFITKKGNLEVWTVRVFVWLNKTQSFDVLKRFSQKEHIPKRFKKHLQPTASNISTRTC